uniref:Reverse transcriptase domain-containing protein n=1 Tax=Tanacetum cinerariifolium TaxID=118510 RepID=A0A6L2L8Q8_TANCI|nr:reverse transcriptase domain-containing protein [Tanacetum cinerariifolium]
MASDGSDRNAEYALSRLLQRGTVAEYQNEFEMLISRVTGKSESLLQTIYVFGLKLMLQIELLRNIKEKANTALSLTSEEASPVLKGSLVHFGHHLHKFLPSHCISNINPHSLLMWNTNSIFSNYLVKPTAPSVSSKFRGWQFKNALLEHPRVVSSTPPALPPTFDSDAINERVNVIMYAYGRKKDEAEPAPPARDPRDVETIQRLQQRIQELELQQLQSDSPAEEAETEPNISDDEPMDVNPFGRKKHRYINRLYQPLRNDHDVDRDDRYRDDPNRSLGLKIEIPEFTKISSGTKPSMASMPSANPMLVDLNEMENVFQKLFESLEKNSKRESIFYTSQEELRLIDVCLHGNCQKNIELEKDLSKFEAKSIAFEIALHHKSRENKSLKTLQKENENFIASLQIENAHLKQTYKDLFELVQRSRVETSHCDEVKVKDNFDEIETQNIKLEHRVASLIKENENLKLTYQSLFDLIKKSRVQTKTSNVTQNKAENLKTQLFEFAETQFNNILEKIEFFKKNHFDSFSSSNVDCNISKLKKASREKHMLFESETSVFQIKVDELEKSLAKQTKENYDFGSKVIHLEKIIAQKSKDFDDVNLELSNRTAKFEVYFEKLKKKKVVLERQLARKVHDSKAEKINF